VTAHSPIEATPTPLRHKRHSALLRGLVIFICGALAGAGLSSILLTNLMANRFRHPELMLKRMMSELTKTLELSPEQQIKVEIILQKNREEMDAMFREEIRPKVDARFNSMREEIAAVLDEKQAAEWKQNFDQIRKRFGPPGPPPAAPG